MAIENVALLAIENVTLRGLTCGGSGGAREEPGDPHEAGSREAGCSVCLRFALGWIALESSAWRRIR